MSRIYNINEYTVKWSDGEAAASRGTDMDSAFISVIHAKDNDEALRIAHLMRRICLLNEEVDGSEDEELLDEAYIYGLEEDEIATILSENDPARELDNINMDGIDGGDPWIISIKDPDGNLIYDNTEADIADPKSTIKALPNEVIISEADWKAIYTDYEYDFPFEEFTADDFKEFLEYALEDLPSLTKLNKQRKIYEFGEWVGTIRPEEFTTEQLPNGDVKFSNIEWEADID